MDNRFSLLNRSHPGVGLAIAAIACVVLLAGGRAQAQSYDVDPVHSFVLFSVHHFNAGYVWGRFDKVAGSFAINDSDPTQDTFNVTVDAGSLDTNNKARDKHVSGPDFLDAQTYPDITFKSTAVKKTGDTTLEVTGDLTLHGTTKSVVVEMDLTGKAADPMKQGTERFGVETELKINRQDYGVKGLPGAVGDEVRLIIALEGTSAAQ